MEEKSLARLEMELEELQEKKAAIKKPRGAAFPVIVVVVGVLLFWLSDNGFVYLCSAFLFILGLILILDSFMSGRTHKRETEEVDNAIKNKREEIIRAKEKLD